MSLDFEVIDPFDPLDLQVPRHVILAAGREGLGQHPADPLYRGVGIPEVTAAEDLILQHGSIG